jgi:uroporphyrin-3 C-methyltransferase
MTDKEPTEMAQSDTPGDGSQPDKASSATAKTTPPPTASTPQKPGRQDQDSRSGKLGILALLVAIVALACAAWIWWQLREIATQQQELASLQQLDQRANELKSSLQTLTGGLSTLQQGLSEQRKIGEERQQRLLQIGEQMKTLTDSRPSDWMLAEANYHVTLAARRLKLEHDVETTIVLLQAADDRIQEMNDPGLIDLRQALADDINKLRALPRIDKEGMALTLNSLQRQISKLPLSSVVLPEVIDAEEQQELSDDPAEWADNLVKSWASMMDGFITVRKRSGPVEPLLAPDQRWFLVENLRTKLLQAQLALYREQQDAWQDSLSQALSWSESFFDLSSPATQSVLTELSALSQRPITADYPSDLAVRSLLLDELAERARARLSSKPSSQAPSEQADTAEAEITEAVVEAVTEDAAGSDIEAGEVETGEVEEKDDVPPTQHADQEQVPADETTESKPATEPLPTAEPSPTNTPEPQQEEQQI